MCDMGFTGFTTAEAVAYKRARPLKRPETTRTGESRAIRAKHCSMRRGMTFIEVVFAMALFGVVAASVLGVISFSLNAQLREQRTLACAEVANRMVLAYLDDSTSMPDPHKTLEYGPSEDPLKFRWEYREDGVTLVESGGDARDRSRVSPLRQDRFRQITVHVWLGEESGGTYGPDESTPQVTLTRMFDPLYTRNPDSFMKMMMDPAGRQRFFDYMQGNYRNTGNAAGSTPATQLTGPQQMGRGIINPVGAFGVAGNKGTTVRPMGSK
jgi:prepilin-type N-terminal cleavage/methylation domain-containing protein